MSIIDPPFRAATGAGGMEYPTLVTTAADGVLSPRGVRLPELITVHEVGHNWFQGMLASNEVEEAWLDEGVNGYVDGLVMAAIYGEADLIDWQGWTLTTFEVLELSHGKVSAIPDPITTPSYAFDTPDPTDRFPRVRCRPRPRPVYGRGFSLSPVFYRSSRRPLFAL